MNRFRTSLSLLAALGLGAFLGCNGGTTTTASTGSGGATSTTGKTTGATTAQATTSATTNASTGTGTTDTWTNFAQAFYAKYCVECHAAGNPNRDYTTLAGVMKDAALDRCGVSTKAETGCTGSPAPKQFPINDATSSNPKPTDAERTRVVAWIDAGLPN